jgi:hypothetical protein
MTPSLRTVTRRAAIALILAAAVSRATRAQQQRAPASTEIPKIAIQGYDTVAYFTEGRPVKGGEDYETEWLGARWRFASAQHRDMFTADPERYAPRYGGYCAASMAYGNRKAPSPESWKIVDGRLYLLTNQGSLDRWQQNASDNIRKGDEHWAALRDQE